MDRERHVVAVLDVIIHIFDLIREDIWCIHFDGGRQVNDNLPAFAAFPGVKHGVTDLGCIVHLGAGKGLRRVFEVNLAGEGACILFHKLRAGERDVNDLFLRLPEHDVPLEDRGGIIDVDDGLRKPLQALESLFELLSAALHEHLYQHIIRDQLPFD